MMKSNMASCMLRAAIKAARHAPHGLSKVLHALEYSWIIGREHAAVNVPTAGNECIAAVQSD